MRLSTEEHPMLLAEPSHNTPAAREKMVELMFEKYNVPGKIIFEIQIFYRLVTLFYVFKQLKCFFNFLLCSCILGEECCAQLLRDCSANFSGGGCRPRKHSR